MFIFKKWSRFNRDNVSLTKNSYGVYELGDTNGEVQYIGQGRIKSRLNSHFVIESHPIPGTKSFRHEYTGSKERAEQIERVLLRSYERQRGKLPKYNHKIG